MPASIFLRDGALPSLNRFLAAGVTGKTYKQLREMQCSRPKEFESAIAPGTERCYVFESEFLFRFAILCMTQLVILCEKGLPIAESMAVKLGTCPTALVVAAIVDNSEVLRDEELDVFELLVIECMQIERDYFFDAVPDDLSTEDTIKTYTKRLNVPLLYVKGSTASPRAGYNKVLQGLGHNIRSSFLKAAIGYSWSTSISHRSHLAGTTRAQVVEEELLKAVQLTQWAQCMFPQQILTIGGPRGVFLDPRFLTSCYLYIAFNIASNLSMSSDLDHIEGLKDITNLELCKNYVEAASEIYREEIYTRSHIYRGPTDENWSFFWRTEATIRSKFWTWTAFLCNCDFNFMAPSQQDSFLLIHSIWQVSAAYLKATVWSRSGIEQYRALMNTAGAIVKYTLFSRTTVHVLLELCMQSYFYLLTAELRVGLRKNTHEFRNFTELDELSRNAADKLLYMEREKVDERAGQWIQERLADIYPPSSRAYEYLTDNEAKHCAGKGFPEISELCEGMKKLSTAYSKSWQRTFQEMLEKGYWNGISHKCFCSKGLHLDNEKIFASPILGDERTIDFTGTKRNANIARALGIDLDMSTFLDPKNFQDFRALLLHFGYISKRSNCFNSEED